MQKLQELWVWSLSREDPLKKEMATHSSILAWRSPWIEDLGRLQSMGLQRVRHDWATNTINYKIAALVFLQLQIYCKSWSLSLKAPHLQGDLFLEPFLEVLFNWMLYFPEDFPACLFGQRLVICHCGAGEDSWESLGLQGDPTSPS